jgi:hypothetical protein
LNYAEIVGRQINIDAEGDFDVRYAQAIDEAPGTDQYGVVYEWRVFDKKRSGNFVVPKLPEEIAQKYTTLGKHKFMFDYAYIEKNPNILTYNSFIDATLDGLEVAEVRKESMAASKIMDKIEIDAAAIVPKAELSPVIITNLSQWKDLGNLRKRLNMPRELIENTPRLKSARKTVIITR